MAKQRAGIRLQQRKPLSGEMGSKGKTFNPNALPPLGTVEELREPRPGTTRYPIDLLTFAKLKEASHKAKKLRKDYSTVVVDEARRRPEVAARMPSAAAPSVAVTTGAGLTPSTNFAGISATGWLPPDCTLAVGPDHLVASVNSSVAIYQKSGGAPLLQQALTVWFSKVVRNATIFDPKVIYDQHAGRWVLLAVAVIPTQKRSWFLLSISKTTDAMSPWFSYALDATLDGKTKINNWVDYPAIGVDSQALYLTGNMFQFEGDFQYAKVRIVPKAGPYSGGKVVYKDLVNLKNADNSIAFTVQPCHTFGAPQVQYFVNSIYPTDAKPENKLSVWSLSNPLSAKPVLALRTVDISSYALPPDSLQKGGGTPLDTGDVRILNAVFRGGSIWCAFATRHNWGEAINVAAIHWLQIEAATGRVIQQGIYGDKGNYYSYPAVMPDNNGDMVMVFSRCSETEFASIYFTGRKASDAFGELQPSLRLKAGTANYLGLDRAGRNRWGDYAGIADDPANPGVIWFYSGFAGTASWETWIGSAF